VTTAANTVTLLEKSAGRDEAASRHAVAFGPTFRVPLNKITRREAEDFNSIVLDRLAVLVPAREKIADRLQAQLADEFARDFLTLTKNFDKHDLWTELAKDALDVYQSVRRRDRDDKTTKAEVREYLRENEKGVNARIDRIVRRANERGLFDGSRETILLHMVLIAESGAKFLVRSLRGELDSITKEILFGYQKAASPADKFLLYYTLGEGDFPPLPASAQMGELLDSIQKRTNEITLGGFNDKMFETVRGTIKENLYEAVDGCKGAAEIARQLGKELRAKFNDLPKEANNRLMLWARTEGCVVQNDALMARGEDVGMDGKIWQTVGDSRVRDAHILNEAAGVIPIADMFPDGSTDGGAGSVSPYFCRCAVGPALLPSKRGKKEEDKPKKPEAAAPKAPTVPRVPKVPKTPKPTGTTVNISRADLPDDATPSEVFDALKEAYDAKIPIDSDTKKALDWYIGGGSVDMNAFLRGTAAVADLDVDTAKNTKLILNHIAKAQTGEALTTYRGVGAQFVENFDAANPAAIVGEKFKEDGIVSTAFMEKKAAFFADKNRSGIIFEIDMPKGSNFTIPPGFENEILLQPGEFVITSYEGLVDTPQGVAHKYKITKL